jgi:hypothetical protein
MLRRRAMRGASLFDARNRALRSDRFRRFVRGVHRLFVGFGWLATFIDTALIAVIGDGLCVTRPVAFMGRNVGERAIAAPRLIRTSP